MFRIQMLPADHGDCLWVEYGEAAAPKVILIDGGTTGTWKRLKKKIIAEKAKRGGKLRFELFVVTHVDADHIGGSLKLLEEVGALGVTFGDVWFNGYFHLDNERPPSRDVLGGKQGEQLSVLIDGWDLKWNEAFGSKAVMVPDRGALPVRTVAGMKLTLLSPTFEKLQALKPKWEQEVINAGLKPGDAYEAVDVEMRGDTLGEDVAELADRAFKGDRTEANGSSIAFLAEYEGKSVLFGADAHADVLLASLARLPAGAQPALPLAGFKVSHHGSRNNTSSELVKALPAKRYLVSTNGNQFGHPHPEAIARIAVYGPKKKKLDFNCRSEFNEEWASASRIADWSYSAAFGTEEDGRTVEL